MSKVKDPDITIDECPDCQGTWLDAGELNALATGLAGDIEFCSAERKVYHAEDPERSCPRCKKEMITVSPNSQPDANRKL